MTILLIIGIVIELIACVVSVLLFEPRGIEVDCVRGTVDLAQEAGEAADQCDHCSDEHCAGEPLKVGGEKLLREQRYNDKANQ